MGAPARYIAAAVNVSLTAYAAVSTAVLKLLRCVSTPRSVLFIDGSVLCSFLGWQLPLLLLLLALAAFPVVVLVGARWAVDRASARAIGVRRALVAPYRRGQHGWEAALVLQRLLLALLFTFASTGGGAVVFAVVTTALCVCALVANVVVAPLRSVVAHRLQTVLLVCLCALALVAVPAAEDVSLAGRGDTASMPTAATASLVAVVNTGWGVVVPVVSVAAAFVGPWAAKRYSGTAR